MEPGNTRTVFVVQVDNTKDLSDAKRFGQLRAVFGNPRKPYDTARMIASARKVLAGWEFGDHLLMIGDPTLCAVCAAILSEDHEVIDILSWERNTFQYVSQRWNFGEYGVDLATADD